MPLVAAVEGNGMAGENFSQQVAEGPVACANKEVKMVAQQRPGITSATSLR